MYRVANFLYARPMRTTAAMATPQTRASPPHGTLAQQAARALLVFAFIALTTASGLAQTRDTPIPPRRPASLAQDPTPVPTLAPPPAPPPAAAPTQIGPANVARAIADFRVAADHAAALGLATALPQAAISSVKRVQQGQ